MSSAAGFGRISDIQCTTLTCGSAVVIDRNCRAVLSEISVRGNASIQGNLSVNGSMITPTPPPPVVKSITNTGTAVLDISGTSALPTQYQFVYLTEPGERSIISSDQTPSFALPSFSASFTDATFAGRTLSAGALAYNAIYDGPDVNTANLVSVNVLKYEIVRFINLVTGQPVEWTGTAYSIPFKIYETGELISSVADAESYINTLKPFLTINSDTGEFEGLILPVTPLTGDILAYEPPSNPLAFVNLFSITSTPPSLSLDIFNTGTYMVDWGDGTVETNTSSHVYPDNGIYQVTFTGNVNGSIQYRFSNTEEQWMDVLQFGDVGVTSLSFAAWNTEKNSVMTRITDTSGPPASMIFWDGMFYGCQNANPDVSVWDSSNVTSLRNMFSYTDKADPDVSMWVTSNVTDFGGMFEEAAEANPDVSNWDMSSAVTARYMFWNTPKANPDISNWDAPLLEDMQGMFEQTSIANPTFGPQWLTNIEVRDVRRMFFNAQSANVDMTNVPSGLWQFQDNMIDGAPSWSQANYDILITKWRDFPFTASFNQKQGTFAPIVPGYTAGGIIETYRTYLTFNRAWTIIDGGPI